MADHPDITVVKQGYEAFNSADIETLSTLIADDAVQHMPDGTKVDQPNALVFRVEGGKIVELTDTTSDLDAYNATWA